MKGEPRTLMLKYLLLVCFTVTACDHHKDASQPLPKDEPKPPIATKENPNETALNLVKLNMSPQEVISQIGQPIAKRKLGENRYEYLYSFAFRSSQPNTSYLAGFQIRFTDDKVSEIPDYGDWARH